MWFLNQFDVESSAYNVPLSLRISGSADPSVIHAALVDVIARHEVLRTVYPSDDQGPTSRLWNPVRSRSSCCGGKRARARSWRRWRPADSTSVWDCPCAGWLESGDDLLEVVIVVHHIAFDGGSAKPFAADLVAAFAARREDPIRS